MASCNVCKMSAIELMSFTGDVYSEDIKKHGKVGLSSNLLIFCKENVMVVTCVQNGAT